MKRSGLPLMGEKLGCFTSGPAFESSRRGEMNLERRRPSSRVHGSAAQSTFGKAAYVERTEEKVFPICRKRSGPSGKRPRRSVTLSIPKNVPRKGRSLPECRSTSMELGEEKRGRGEKAISSEGPKKGKRPRLFIPAVSLREKTAHVEPILRTDRSRNGEKRKASPESEGRASLLSCCRVRRNS